MKYSTLLIREKIRISKSDLIVMLRNSFKACMKAQWEIHRRRESGFQIWNRKSRPRQDHFLKWLRHMLPTIATAKTLAFAHIAVANRELTGTVIHKVKYDQRLRSGDIWILNKHLQNLVQAHRKAILIYTVVPQPLRRWRMISNAIFKWSSLELVQSMIFTKSYIKVL